MKFDKKYLLIFLVICYLLFGIFFWSSGQGINTPFHLFTIVYLTLFWPLVISVFMFSFIAITAILGLIVAVVVLVIKKRWLL